MNFFEAEPIQIGRAPQPFFDTYSDVLPSSSLPSFFLLRMCMTYLFVE